MTKAAHSPGSGPIDLESLTRVFAEFFFGARAEPPNADIESVIVVAPSVAESGGWQAISFERFVRCPKCNTSASYYRDAVPCGKCYGSGKVEQSSGQIRLAGVCPACGGQSLRAVCGQCNRGFVARSANLRVHVPAGTKPGQRLRLSGKGHDRLSAAPGDAYVEVLVEGASSGVGPLRVPVRRAGELPPRCFVCAERRNLERVFIGVNERIGKVRTMKGAMTTAGRAVIGIMAGFGFSGYEVRTLDLHLCRRHHTQWRRHRRFRRLTGYLSFVIVVGFSLGIFCLLLPLGMAAALLLVLASSVAVVFGGRRWLQLANEKNPFHIWIDEDRNEFVFPALRADPTSQEARDHREGSSP